MIAWKLTTNHKKIQRHINKVLRLMNKNIEQDNLWLGRFYCHQRSIRWDVSEDHTYVYCVVEVEFIDRKTGKTYVTYFHKEDFMGSTWRFWTAMNNFIVDYCAVWLEVPPPSIKNPWDYRKELKNDRCNGKS